MAMGWKGKGGKRKMDGVDVKCSKILKISISYTCGTVGRRHVHANGAMSIKELLKIRRSFLPHHQFLSSPQFLDCWDRKYGGRKLVRNVDTYLPTDKASDDFDLQAKPL
jgi:hypothetical protein